jgi:hypothetical protein
VTALNPVIGYEKGAAIAKKAYAEKRPVIDVAVEMTDLSPEELKRLLDPLALTDGGIQGAAAGDGKVAGGTASPCPAGDASGHPASGSSRGSSS